MHLLYDQSLRKMHYSKGPKICHSGLLQMIYSPCEKWSMLARVIINAHEAVGALHCNSNSIIMAAEEEKRNVLPGPAGSVLPNTAAKSALKEPLVLFDVPKT